MKTIKDLPFPITAMKADWMPADSWIGFTPTGKGLNAAAQCQSTINKQAKNGYIIEYITQSIQEPNEGYENEPSYLETLKEHPQVAGRLIAIHKIRASSRPLEEILGNEAYEKMQDVWAKPDKRVRWSVAFPIVESYEIINKPLAKKIFSEESQKSIIRRSSATLRELSEKDRISLSYLEIKRIETRNEWIAIEDEIEISQKSNIDQSILDLINDDLPVGAFEGETEEKTSKIKRRAAWLAQKFALRRSREGTLICDHCSYDPKDTINCDKKYLRSLLDVHHTDPIKSGFRYTRENDFELLCPNCHRLEHLKIRMCNDDVL